MFPGAATYTCLLFLEKLHHQKIDYYELKDSNQFKKNPILTTNSFLHESLPHPPNGGPWNFVVGAQGNLMKKLDSCKLQLDDITEDIFAGFQTGRDQIFTVEIVQENRKLAKIRNVKDQSVHTIEKALLKKMISFKKFKRWIPTWKNIYIIYPYEITNEGTKLISINIMKIKFPKTFQYFQHYNVLYDNHVYDIFLYIFFFVFILIDLYFLLLLFLNHFVILY